ncbi:hypothetical protein RhiTH_003548 [Rhizoctonia solani]
MSVLLPTTPQAIENLGGAKGYLEHLKRTGPSDSIVKPLSLLSLSNSLNSNSSSSSAADHNCSIHLQSGPAGTLFGEIEVHEKPEGDVSVNVKYKTQIRAWITQGSGRTDLHGNIALLTSWDDMLNGPINFTIIAAEKQGAHVKFKRDYLPAAEISADFPNATGYQCGSYECEGVCQWEKIFF